jgi:hypothetical protein
MFGIATDNLLRGPFGLSTALGVVSLPVIALGLACAWLGRGRYDRARLAVDPVANLETRWPTPTVTPVAAKTGA